MGKCYCTLLFYTKSYSIGVSDSSGVYIIGICVKSGVGGEAADDRPSDIAFGPA